MTGTNYADLIYSKYQDKISMLEDEKMENPVSSLSNFLKLCHYKKNNDPRFEKLAKQTVLYFNNPDWLRFQLTQVESEESIPEVNETGHFAVILPEEEITKEREETIGEIIPVESNGEAIESDMLPVAVGNNLPAEEYKEETTLESTEEISRLEEPIESINKELISEQNKEEIIAVEPSEEELETPGNSLENQSVKENEEVAFEPKEEILETDELKNNAPFEKVTNEQMAFEPLHETVENNPAEIKTASLIADETADEQVAFEPLHTVDYFASQGIKIREEVLMNDKLGKQMKSFTDWLKSMKKLHPGKLPEQNEVIEKIIQSSAEESNADAEVLTEAMAEVLIKQDKQDKAIEMYRKLSLMNPSKSAYFAAKIESIKTN